ncbi:hypothetical protein P9112_004177 [Eukaryota sp. TZLM1-RC]
MSLNLTRFCCSSCIASLHVKHLTFESEISCNSRNRVFIAFRRSSRYVLKQVPHSSSEHTILKVLDHPNIISLVDSYIEGRYRILVFPHVNHLVLPFKFSLSRIKDISLQLLYALDYLHNKGITHNDVCLNNILISNDFHVTIIDFECATTYPIITPSFTTPSYLPPEACIQEQIDGRKADVWSLGVCLFQLSFGHYPFEEYSLSGLVGSIAKGDVKYPDYASPSLVDFLRKMLTKNHRERSCIRQLLRHEFVNG